MLLGELKKMIGSIRQLALKKKQRTKLNNAKFLKTPVRRYLTIIAFILISIFHGIQSVQYLVNMDLTAIESFANFMLVSFYIYKLIEDPIFFAKPHTFFTLVCFFRKKIRLTVNKLKNAST